MHGVQSSKADQPDWCNKNIYETQLQAMYGGVTNGLIKGTWQTLHMYEQEFKDIWGLPAQNDLPSVLPEHWWSCLMGERVIPYNIFQTLGFKTPTVVLVYGKPFIGPKRSISHQKLRQIALFASY